MASIIDRALNEPEGMNYLARHGWPVALQHNFIKELRRIPKRFMIIDDSGSMSASDGHRVIGEGVNKKIISSTRWGEIGDFVNFHAGFSEACNAPTEFRLLNAHAPITVGNGSEDDGQGVRKLKELMSGSPGGGTPLCTHIRSIVAQIQAMRESLLNAGEKVVLVIATDGESSDGDIAVAMAPLKDLPVHVVIRLCTDQERICDYWNNIDKQLEIQLDILDDLSGEAKEVEEHNPWLTYGEPLHRMREFGVSQKEIDLLDEAKLTSDQILVITRLILGGTATDYPHPELDQNGFVTAVNAALHREMNVWDPVHQRGTTWILPNKVHSRGGSGDSGGGGGLCVIS